MYAYSRSLRRQAFTLIELLIVISIIALLAVILVPSIARARESAHRMKCGANLAAIGKGMVIYKTGSHDRYPVLGEIYALGGNQKLQLKAEFRQSSIRPFDDGAGWDEDTYGDVAQQCFYMLIYKDLVEPDAFVCPSSDDLPLKRTGGMHGFANAAQISYGIQFPTKKSVRQGGGIEEAHMSPLDAKLSPEVAIAADHAATTQLDLWTGNLNSWEGSINHDREGLSVLYGGGHVSFTRTPWVGAKADNVYIWDIDPNTGKVFVGQRLYWNPTQHRLDSMIVHSNWEPEWEPQGPGL